MFAELRAAPLPMPLKKIAVHLYLNFYINDTIERWELWQSENAFEKHHGSIAFNLQREQHLHIYKNLKNPKDGVGGGPSFHIETFCGQQAETLYNTTRLLSKTYKYKNYYLAWPGPNSNTYIATIFKLSGIPISLPATAIGKDFCGIIPKIKSKEQNIKFQFLTTGFHYKKKHFLEFHCLGLTIGYEKASKQWKLPFGKGIFPYKNTKDKIYPFEES